ncbi:dipeptide/oligopeptide/nickel ABC transporter permease/ATP-binding protein [Microbacterium sp. 1.5R]|uniref:dipeptide/oligopeptide/nickel ABC transporter permease/ATP-binding protein n=1 Tax=Microbacterium sp. 1.5R TaxID=1916917 RepID=UPI0011A60B14|nr:dipeptide/oligopeptide/nickel ABC transporter permease/ATP-binding protein [Microbacterium sp. 1.5R]
MALDLTPTTTTRLAVPGRASALLRQMRRNALAVAGAVWLAVLVIACVAAPWLASYDPLTQDLTAVLQLPSPAHLLGTDGLGRDVLARLLFGGQDALLGAVEVVVIAAAIGLPLGVLAGFNGGWLDAVANRFSDLLFSLPAIVVLLAVAAVFGSSTLVSMAALGVLLSAAYIRLVRASTLAVRNELYVDAARVSGISRTRIVFGHVLPNVVGPLIVQSSLTLGVALLIQGGLGFLGLGPKPPAPNWGGMIADASAYLYQQAWLMVPTGLVLVLTILSVNLIGDALRDGDGRRQRYSLLLRAPATASAAPAARAESTPSTDAVLAVRDLHVTFGHGADATSVVRGIDFTVARGETVGLVGESGSGKTMTALAILGLLPYPGHVSDGEIVFCGENIAAYTERQLAGIRGKKVAMISQEPMLALDPSFSILTQLRAPLRRHRGLSRAESARAAEELLRQVGIPQPDRVLRSFPHQLSGGMAQRVAIAIALAGEPDLLIADEPTTALDVTVQAGILDLLRSLQDRTGMAVIFVTHDLGVVADICSRAVVMQQGRIVESASVTDLFSNPQHPYTRQLIAATPSLVELGGEYV